MMVNNSISKLKKWITEKNKELSHEEILWLFRKDHSKRTDKEIENLINANLAMVLSLSTQYSNNQNDIIDLFSSGLVGLNKAIEKYDSKKGTKFSTYAYWWIRQAINKYIRECSYPLKTYHYAPINIVDNDALINMYSDNEMSSSTRDMVKTIYDKLNKNEQDIFRLIYIEEMTITEASKEIDKAISTIQYHLRKIRKKIDEIIAV